MSVVRDPHGAVISVAVAIGLLGLAAPVPCRAQKADQLPQELEGVGITEHLEGQVPLNLEFVDETGRKVRLSDYFDGQRPVILTLNYYRCPMLCTLQLNGLIAGLQEMSWLPGQQFEIVTVSIDPAETPSLAAAKKQSYMTDYGRPSAAAGWHFLTGKQKAIKTLADEVGFGYRWNPERKQWMHAAALFVCTPDGKLSRYLYGVQYDPDTLRLSLVEASAGKAGSSLDRVILYCYQYDPSAGKYGLVSLNVVRVGGVLTLLALGLLLMPLWLRETRRRRKASTDHPS
jgi:protein SCO1/2